MQHSMEDDPRWNIITYDSARTPVRDELLSSQKIFGEAPRGIQEDNTYLNLEMTD